MIPKKVVKMKRMNQEVAHTPKTALHLDLRIALAYERFESPFVRRRV